MRWTIILAGSVSFAMALLGTTLALALVAPTLVSAQEARVRAEQVTILGDGGAERIRLQTGPGINARMVVLSADGTPRANIATGGAQGTTPEGAGFTLLTSTGTPVGRLGMGDPAMMDDGVVNLHLRDRSGRDRILLKVAEDGTPSIELMDANGTVTWSAR